MTGLLPALALLLLAQDGGAPTETGLLCLPPATWIYPKASMVPETVDPARATEPPRPMPYAVQVDDREPVEVTTSAVAVEGLDLASKHQVRVIVGGKTQVRFRFTFSNGDGPRQALNYSSAYGSWGLRKAGRRECRPRR